MLKRRNVEMKKALGLFVLTLLFVLTGCSEPGEKLNDLEKALESMDSAESYRMDMTMNNIPLFGTMSLVLKVDGDISYMSNPFGDPVYTKTIDGVEYEYVLNENDVLELSDTPMDMEDADETEDYLSDIEAVDFEQDEENDLVWTYTLERMYLNADETEYMSDIVITLDDDGMIDSMTFTLYSDDFSSDIEIEFSGINNTTVTVPGN